MDDKEIQRLITACLEARDRAYAPYSKFFVGAALLTKDGEVITGCNVENCSYPLCTCAERCVVVKAVSSGYREFKAIAVTGKSQAVNSRQVLAEFGPDTQVIMAKSDRAYHISTMMDLLPLAFTPKNLK